MSIPDNQKVRGRPATGVTPMQGVRMPADLLAAVEEFDQAADQILDLGAGQGADAVKLLVAKLANSMQMPSWRLHRADGLCDRSYLC